MARYGICAAWPTTESSSAVARNWRLHLRDRRCSGSPPGSAGDHRPLSAMPRRRLVSRLKREENTAVREAILNSLVRLDDPMRYAADWPTVCAAKTQPCATRSSRPSSTSSGEVAARITADLCWPIPIPMCASSSSISWIPIAHPEVERWLIEVIERDAHVNVCATAVDLLCEVGTEAAIEPLLRLKARFAPEAVHPVCRRSGAEAHSRDLTL